MKPRANFTIAEKPLCELKQMGKATTYSWITQDFSEGESVRENFAITFKTVDQANDFVTSFQAAQIFNQDAKAGKPVIMA
jgi:hypothetical protein